MNSIRFKVLTNLENCQYVLGDTQEAVKNFKLAYDIIEIKTEIAARNRALASLLEDKPLEGIPFIDEALRLNKSVENINLKSTLLREAGLYDEALKLYEEGGLNEK